MASEVLAVQKMTEDLKSSGMPEAQANATVRAIAEGIKTFAVTREVLQDELAGTRGVLREELHRELQRELAPIHTRIDKLEGNLERKIDTLSGRMFLLTISVVGVLGASLAAVLAALLPFLRTL